MNDLRIEPLSGWALLEELLPASQRVHGGDERPLSDRHHRLVALLLPLRSPGLPRQTLHSLGQ